MKGNSVSVLAMSEQNAARFTAENKHGYVWPAGLYVMVDNERSVLESRHEVDDLIKRLSEEADLLWPRS